jgi:ATP-dependent DNA ligase
MEQIKPQLAAKASTKTIEKLMADPDWVAELKYNGWRYIANFQEDTVDFTSRRTSVKSGKKVEKGSRIPHLSKPVKAMVGTILDGEIVTKEEDCNASNIGHIMGADPEKAVARQEEEGYVHYKVYDILAFKGKDVQGLPKFMRDNFRKQAIKLWNNDHAHFVTQSRDKEELLHYAWSHDLEGIILKNLKAVYTQDGRDPEVWVKVKKQNSEPYDCVILGYEDPDRWTYKKHPDETAEGGPVERKGYEGKWYRCENRFYQQGWIASIIYGCYDKKKGDFVQVGTVSGMTDKVRAMLSGKRGENYVGRVIELDGQEIYKDAIIHPRFKALKDIDEKDPKDCTIEDLYGKRATKYE